MMGFKTGQKKRPEDDVSLLDPDDWSREIYTVAKDYFSPLAALTRNFVSHVQMDDKRQKIRDNQESPVKATPHEDVD
jgi:hypothetical protein